MFELELVGEGVYGKVFRRGDRAFKLDVDATLEEVQNEAERQIFAANSGLPVPKVYGVTQLQEGFAIEMEYIPGQVLVKPKMDRADRMTAFQELVKLQCSVHKIDAKGLPKQRDVLDRKIKNAPLEASIVDALLKRLQSLDHGESSLCHGDFHTSNILKADSKLWIVDWVDATSGSPLADACRSYLIFRQYISRMAGVYLRLFCKEANVKAEQVLAWLPVVGAGRLRENPSVKERDLLMRDILECVEK